MPATSAPLADDLRTPSVSGAPRTSTEIHRFRLLGAATLSAARKVSRSESGALIAGEAVAQCGNSGNSSEPHLHLHVMDHPQPLVAAGIPFRFVDAGEQPRPCPKTAASLSNQARPAVTVRVPPVTSRSVNPVRLPPNPARRRTLLDVPVGRVDSRAKEESMSIADLVSLGSDVPVAVAGSAANTRPPISSRVTPDAVTGSSSGSRGRAT